MEPETAAPARGQELHPVVREAARAHLLELNTVAPGLVEMLYLVGSVALGDYRDGLSDIDFLAVTSRPPGPVEVAVLADLHERMRLPGPGRRRLL